MLVEGDGGWELEARVAEMRRLGITKLRISPANLEIELGPAPAPPPPEALIPGESEEDRSKRLRELAEERRKEKRRQLYRAELGYTPDDKTLEMLP